MERNNTFKIFLLLIILIAWLGIFVIAISTESMSFRSELREVLHHIDGINIIELFSILALVVITWTWSSTLILCSLASLIGELGRTASLTSNSMPNYGAALARGFFIFLVLITGQLVINGGLDPMNSSIDRGPGAQFFRITTFGSLLGFIVGYSPTIFSKILDRTTQTVLDKTSVTRNEDDKNGT